MDLTFQVTMQYYSLQHWTSLSLPDTCTAEYCFCFGPAISFFLELLVIALCSSPVAYWTPSDLGRWWCGNHFLVSYFLPFCMAHEWASLMAQWFRICLQCRRLRRCRFHSWVGKIPCRRKWQPTPVFLPGESHEQRSLVGHSP